MPRGEKSKHTDKHERKAGHIAQSLKSLSEEESKREAWATVNKDEGGTAPGGAGKTASTVQPAAHKAGHLGGKASAKKAAATAKKHGGHHGKH